MCLKINSGIAAGNAAGMQVGMNGKKQVEIRLICLN
jgi:hypothetical protein